MQILDNFESGSNGASLSGSGWTSSAGIVKSEYDSDIAGIKEGSLCAYIKGATSNYSSVTKLFINGGILNTDNQELIFWFNIRATNQNAYLSIGSNSGGAVIYLRWNSSGNVTAYYDSDSAYHNIATYAAGWQQYRIVFNFTNHTFDLYRRASTGDAWTKLNSSALQFRNQSATYAKNFTIASYNQVDLYFDDVQYSDPNFFFLTNTDSASGSDSTNQLEKGITDSGVLAENIENSCWDDWFPGYTYRMKVPIANEYACENKSFSFKFPAWWLKEKGKIIGSSYEDIRVVTASGYLLNHSINEDNDTITVDYPQMPLGRTNLWIYYGKSGESAQSEPVGIYSGAVQVMEANEETIEDGTDYVWYVWGENIDDASLDSSSVDTYYGANSTFNLGFGASGSAKYHYLLKFFEGMLPKGTVTDAKLNIYFNTPSAYSENGTLKCHKLLSPSSTTFPVGTGWMDQSRFGYPTWNKRYLKPETNSIIDWYALDGCSLLDTEISNTGDEPTVSLLSSYAEGYRYFSLPTEWIDSWITSDDFSQGILLKETSESGATDRTSIISGNRNGTKTKRPVIEVTYSDYDSDQYQNRKISTNTYDYATFSTHRHFLELPSENGFATMIYVNTNMGLDTVYLSPDGRISRILKDVIPPVARFNINSPCFGIYYDSVEKRYWTAGNRHSDNKLVIGYTSPGKADEWTFKVHSSETAAKSAMYVENGVSTLVYFDYSGYLGVVTYTLETDTWSSVTTLANNGVGGTMRSLATGHGILSTDVMEGSGEIYLNGSVSDYRDWGVVRIDGECFQYSSIDRVNNKLTGVTRAAAATSAATHTEGTSAPMFRPELTYIGIAIDNVNECFHITYMINTSASQSAYGYFYNGYIRHYFADPITTWKDESDNTLTLPIDQRNERMVGQPTYMQYFDEIMSLSNGDTIILFRTYDAAFAHQVDTTIARLENGQTSWTYTDLGFLASENSLTEINDQGYIAFSSITSSGTTRRINKYYSLDYGVTVSEVSILAEYILPGIGLWCSSTTGNGYFNGSGLVYALHFTNFGALYVNKIYYYSQISESDSGELSENHQNANYISLIEQMTGNESLLAFVNNSLQDTVIGSELLLILSSISESDTAAGIESILKEWTKNEITLTDSGSAQELIALFNQIGISDLGQALEVLQILNSLQVNDNGTAQDLINILNYITVISLSVSDSGTAQEDIIRAFVHIYKHSTCHMHSLSGMYSKKTGIYHQSQQLILK